MDIQLSQHYLLRRLLSPFNCLGTSRLFLICRMAVPSGKGWGLPEKGPASFPCRWMPAAPARQSGAVRSRSLSSRGGRGFPFSLPIENSRLPLPCDVHGPCRRLGWRGRGVFPLLLRVLRAHDPCRTCRRLLLRKQPSLQTGLGLNLRATTYPLCSFGQITSPL